MENIRIITINTWKCDGNYDKRLELMAAQLKVLSPAIIACQECFQSEEGGADTLAYLADKLDMDALFLPARSRRRIFRGNWVNSLSGLGLLSTFPITAIADYILPEVPGDDERKIQIASVNIPGPKKLLIANTHLTHLRNPELRKEQAMFAAEKAGAHSNFEYRLICGDMNALPGSVEMKALTAKQLAVDAYTGGNGTEPRFSLAEAYDRGIMLCVDHIFCLPLPGTAKYPKFVNSSVVLNIKDKENGIYPSDHFGISTTLVVPQHEQ
jgi:endonuclease/exonuclease/phosphatase family metal-dependent hydrolase